MEAFGSAEERGKETVPSRVISGEVRCKTVWVGEYNLQERLRSQQTEMRYEREGRR